MTIPSRSTYLVVCPGTISLNVGSGLINSGGVVSMVVLYLSSRSLACCTSEKRFNFAHIPETSFSFAVFFFIQVYSLNENCLVTLQPLTFHFATINILWSAFLAIYDFLALYSLIKQLAALCNQITAKYFCKRYSCSHNC